MAWMLVILWVFGIVVLAAKVERRTAEAAAERLEAARLRELADEILYWYTADHYANNQDYNTEAVAEWRARLRA